MTVTAAMCHIYISCFWCCLRYCLNYFHNIIVIAKLKNNLHLSAPFKAQGCGGNLSTYQLGSAHTHTHTHRSADQTISKKEIRFILPSPEGLGEQWRELRWENTKMQLEVLMCVLKGKKKKINREMWVALDPGGLRWINSHIQWMSFTFLISSSHIFFPAFRATFFLLQIYTWIIQKTKFFWPVTSLVVQWLRIHLPRQGTQDQSLVQEDLTCCGATKPMSHSHWSPCA